MTDTTTTAPPAQPEFKALSELSDAERGKTIRAWAAQNGTTVSSSGRLAQSVKDAYAKANGE